jgi:hypothetical protein
VNTQEELKHQKEVLPRQRTRVSRLGSGKGHTLWPAVAILWEELKISCPDGETEAERIGGTQKTES